MSDPFELERFVAAQDGVYGAVRDELAAGEKASHWMWFVFPQLAGLGASPMSRRFALASLAEARSYLAHAVLGARLRECTRLVNAVEHRTARQIFGSPDDLKFRSSMTLFALADPAEGLFAAALRKYFDGVPDARTLARLDGTDP
ncbi:MAG TPA: DUF1810 domain-containing protein [Steroidobacteraceae bacterium]|nr:DUF1810 domain-containing protein [Steroidobacteraceae bacterium]